jgi:hypothetical protein
LPKKRLNSFVVSTVTRSLFTNAHYHAHVYTSTLRKFVPERGCGKKTPAKHPPGPESQLKLA